MGKVALNPDSRIYLDEFDFSGDLNSTSQDISQATPNVTCISDAGPRRIVGPHDVSLSDLGFFEAADDGFDEQIHALLGDGDDHYITKLYGASVIGSVAYDFLARLSAQPRSASIDGAVLLNFDSEGSGGIVRGLVFGNKVTTGAEDIGNQNQGATGAGTIYRAIFRVLAFDGTNITLTMEESSDDGGGDAYATISGVTSGALTDIGCVAAETASATEAWKQLAITGTYTSATIFVSAGYVQGTYVAP